MKLGPGFGPGWRSTLLTQRTRRWAVGLFVLATGCDSGTLAPNEAGAQAPPNAPAQTLPPEQATPPKTPADPTDPADPADPADPDCVPADPADKRSGPGPTIATWQDLELAALAKALPPQIDDMKAGKVGQMERGMAGHGSPNVFASYTDAAGKSHAVVIVDTQHQCHCREGMGQRLAQGKRAGPRAEAMEFGGNPGTANTADGGASDVAVWVGDRCSINISSGELERAKTIAEHLDWQLLGEECAKRTAPPQALVPKLP